MTILQTNTDDEFSASGKIIRPWPIMLKFLLIMHMLLSIAQKLDQLEYTAPT